MTHLDKELEELKSSALEMLELTKVQLENAVAAYVNNDSDIADEVVYKELRVNALDLHLDRECEKILALYNPVATDLRFVTSILMIISEVERIGDHADSIAKYVLKDLGGCEKSLLEVVKFDDIVKISLLMIDDCIDGLTNEDTKSLRNVFKNDKELNRAINNASQMIIEYLKTGKDIEKTLYLFSVIRKFDRVGDLCKNIAEDVIYYVDAKVLKHKKKNKNIIKKYGK